MKHLEFDLVPTELTVNHATNPIKSVFVQKFKGKKIIDEICRTKFSKVCKEI